MNKDICPTCGKKGVIELKFTYPEPHDADEEWLIKHQAKTYLCMSCIKRLGLDKYGVIKLDNGHEVDV